jgi:hypothetical protein
LRRPGVAGAGEPGRVLAQRLDQLGCRLPAAGGRSSLVQLARRLIDQLTERQVDVPLGPGHHAQHVLQRRMQPERRGRRDAEHAPQAVGGQKADA